MQWTSLVSHPLPATTQRDPLLSLPKGSIPETPPWVHFRINYSLVFSTQPPFVDAVRLMVPASICLMWLLCVLQRAFIVPLGQPGSTYWEISMSSFLKLGTQGKRIPYNQEIFSLCEYFELSPNSCSHGGHMEFWRPISPLLFCHILQLQSITLLLPSWSLLE